MKSQKRVSRTETEEKGADEGLGKARVQLTGRQHQPNQHQSPISNPPSFLMVRFLFLLLIFQQPYEEDGIHPILQMKKLRARQLKLLAHCQ